MSHVLGVVFGRDQAHAGATAALDLVQQAGPRAVGKHRILAGAQAEYFLHQLDGFLHRPGVRVGAEIAVLAVRGATVVGHARIFARLRRVVCARRGGDSRELEIGVALVVAEQDVVARLERLDQVVFEDERFCLGAYHRHFQPGDLADHEADAGAPVILLEIAGDAPLQVYRLADVQHLIVGIEIAVHARQGGQGGHLGQQFGAVARCGLDQWRVLHRAARNCCFCWRHWRRFRLFVSIGRRSGSSARHAPDCRRRRTERWDQGQCWPCRIPRSSPCPFALPPLSPSPAGNGTSSAP